MIQLARATQKMFYPEFLPDSNRAQFLPWSSAGDRISGLSESFGTLRFGNLAEILLYDVRRTMSISGPSSVFIDRHAEDWLHARTGASDTSHLVHVPSNPMGWSAGKWAEWYPDVLGENDNLTANIPKPYWQQGWLSQHDRLVASMGAMKERTPMIISGDLHALAKGKMLRSGSHSFEANPIHTIISGPPGTGGAWPSRVRGVLPSVPSHLDFEEEMKPIEENGFMLVDFDKEKTVLRFFKWDIETQSPEEIDTIEPFHTEEIPKPA